MGKASYILFIQLRQLVIFFLILGIACQEGFSQDRKTRNNYTGAWETPSSWNPAWPSPQTIVNNLDITINGYITAHSSLTFSGSSSKLIVDDTLVIIGNLTIADNNDVQVNNNGILIVRGNLTISDDSKIEAKNYIIVTGNIIKLGSTNNGEFSSDDNPVKVFIGGTITPSSLSITKPNFPVFNCSSPPTSPYPHSGCSYGDMTDIITDPIYAFFLSTCAPPTPTATSNTPVCSGTPLTLTGGPPGMTTYSWTGPNGFTSSTQSPTVSPAATAAMAGVYSLTVTNASGCTSAAATTTVVVNPLPVATATSNTPVCSGSSLTLSGGPAGLTTYSWTGPNGFTSSTQSPTVSPAATAAMAGVYSLTVTNASGCTSIATSIVSVNENPIANSGPDQVLDYNFKTQMKAELSSSETGKWSLISGTGRISDMLSPTSWVTELSYGDNVFLWKVRSNDCEASSEVRITVRDLHVPSVITPNGDGKNDYFIIGQHVGRVYLLIFNRWGIEEYRNGSYSNEWDGRNSKGAELPIDTYFYVLKFEDGRIVKGSVLIKR